MISRLIFLAVITLALAGCQSPVSDTTAVGRPPEYYPTLLKANPPLPFSEAVRVGDMLYLAGQLGTAPGTTQVVPGGITAETRQVMENIKEWPAFNAVYREFFKKDFPARSALGTTGLAFGARVEVECIAWIPPIAAK